MWLSLIDPMPAGFDLAEAIHAARVKAHLKHEALAALMGISSQQLSHQLAQRGHLSLGRLLLVASDPDGRVFWRHLVAEIAAYVGAEHTDAVAIELRAVAEALHNLTGPLRKRMLRAEMEPREKRECA